MISKIKEHSDFIEAKPLKKKKEGQVKKNKTKELNIVTLDLEKTLLNEVSKTPPQVYINKEQQSVSNIVIKEEKEEKEEKEIKEEKEEKEEKVIKEEKESLNNIDLLYLTNQHRFFKHNKIDTLLNNNYLLRLIYNNLDENINCFKDEIISTNSLNLKELLENNGYSEGQEKHKLYYLLYVLNLIQHLKEQKIQNLICEDLKDYSNNYKAKNQSINQSENHFNIINETLKFMSSNSSSSKKLTNIDLMVTKKSNNVNKKILPQKWE